MAKGTALPRATNAERTGSESVPEANEICNTSIHDEVFGNMTEDGPNYRDVGWLGTAALMMKSSIGLGVLSIPSAFQVLGLIPGLIALWSIVAITTWSDYQIGRFKIRHPEVYGIDDVGRLFGGKTGGIFFALAMVIYQLFLAAIGMLAVATALNALSQHGTCTVVFVVVAAVAGCTIASTQTLGRISWLAWIGLAFIIVAILTLTISVGVQDRPSDAPQIGPWRSDYKLFGRPSFAEAMSACSSLVFANAGTPGFFLIVSEMRDPQLYTRSLIMCQTTVALIYTIIGVVVYCFCGSYVAEPALGSAGPLLKMVCYGIALPGLLVSTALFLHLASKSPFVRILRGGHHLTSNTIGHWVVWLSCTIGCALIAYVIASGIPIFGQLVSLVGAVLATLLSFQPYGYMWLYDNWTPGASRRNAHWMLLCTWSTFVIVSGSFIMVGGTYGAVKVIIAAPKSGVFACADNSNSS